MSLKSAHADGVISTDEYLYALISEGTDVLAEQVKGFDSCLLSKFRIWCYAVYRGQELCVGANRILSIPAGNATVLDALTDFESSVRSSHTKINIGDALDQFADAISASTKKVAHETLTGNAAASCLGVIIGMHMDGGNGVHQKWAEEFMAEYNVSSTDIHKFHNAKGVMYSVSDLEAMYGDGIFLGVAVSQYFNYCGVGDFPRKHIRSFFAKASLDRLAED